MKNIDDKETQSCSNTPKLHRGDIILVHLNEKNGYPNSGIRPVLSLCDNEKYMNNNIVSVLPISTRIQKSLSHIDIEPGILECDAQVLTDNIITIDLNKQYVKIIGRVSDDTMKKVEDALFIKKS